MIKKKNEHIYRRDLKACVAASLAVIILFFLFLPDPGIKTLSRTIPQEIFISMMDVPSTDQTAPPEAPSVRIKETPYFTSTDEDVFLEDIEVRIPETNVVGKVTENPKTEKPGVYTSLPFSPRVILEVLPEQKEEIEGSVRFKLTIGTDGKVKEHVILSNNLAGKSSLKAVLKAVYESRWQPVSIEGDYIDYQIEKTYAFN